MITRTDETLLERYLNLYQRYGLQHVTPLILRGFEWQMKGFSPELAYQYVANELATANDPRVRYFKMNNTANNIDAIVFKEVSK